MQVTAYFPPFLWDFWLRATKAYDAETSKPPVHGHLNVYDTFENEFREIDESPISPHYQSDAFADLHHPSHGRRTVARLHLLQDQLHQLEIKAETAISILVDEGTHKRYWRYGAYSVPMDSRQADDLRKYIAFLHFRNGPVYQRLVGDTWAELGEEHDASMNSESPSLLFTLEAIGTFLKLGSRHRVGNLCMQSGCGPGDNIYLQELHNLCWRFADSDLSIGKAHGGDHEYILSDSPLGFMDETFDALPNTYNLFLPVTPKLAIYVLCDEDLSSPASPNPLPTLNYIQIFPEAQIDVHLRNAFVLHSAPRRLLFASFRSIALSVSSYDEFRRSPAHQDYSRLKQRCRQKYLQLTVTKTLVIRDAIVVTDLTERVERLGSSPVAHGSFSDVWKAMWEDPVEHRPRFVALKLLRQIMANNVREKLLRRLSSEVAAWHRLCHRNVAQFLGIYQTSTTLGMVSPWCDNGTVQSFLRANKKQDRPAILTDIASGVDYLHSFTPVIVHGDLKSGNILIDSEGKPILTDFGLSKVLDDVAECARSRQGSSTCGGSTRWMAPELIFAMAEDDPKCFELTTWSDVYAFASVCLEIVTGALPYPTRQNEVSVAVDVYRGIRPSQGAKLCIDLKDEEDFWGFLNRCWSPNVFERPSMGDAVDFLRSVVQVNGCDEAV
ncbi:kinase-like domain-containing protein [Schizophyllum commune]